MTAAHADADARTRIEALEAEILEKSKEVAALKRARPPEPVEDYVFQGPDGPESLAALFGPGADLIVIHNMGRRCAWCTLWADGFNGLYPHLASRAAFVVVSPDAVEDQQAFARSRGWRFPMRSARGTTFAADMGFQGEHGPWPGVSTFHRDAAGRLTRVASAPLGPMDPFCSLWHLFALLRDGPADWSPRFAYETGPA
jgi:predicted dithiol-disulfide oxidoreductase (DUF899 family)